MNPEDLIKNIDEKIAELEKQENPDELLKKALLKNKIINSMDDIDSEKANKIFELINKSIQTD